MNIIKVIINFVKSKAVKRFLWITLDGFLALIIVNVSGIDAWWVLPMTGVFQGLTKTINNKMVREKKTIDELVKAEDN